MLADADAQGSENQCLPDLDADHTYDLGQELDVLEKRFEDEDEKIRSLRAQRLLRSLSDLETNVSPPRSPRQYYTRSPSCSDPGAYLIRKEVGTTTSLELANNIRRSKRLRRFSEERDNMNSSLDNNSQGMSHSTERHSGPITCNLFDDVVTIIIKSPPGNEPITTNSSNQAQSPPVDLSGKSGPVSLPANLLKYFLTKGNQS
mmetsp:Transcript_6595/g.11930  ORF Transcript_6595/g.11930 Transcript_6595/m.11930 type:complete len:203 (-) Transcript_6595:50-658(-)